MSTQTQPHSRVFPPEWVADKRQRYDCCPPYARPKLYDLWTADWLKAERDRIEQWAAPLANHELDEVIPRLRDANLFRETYNELAVGASLRSQGWLLEYEPELYGLTPDWLARRAAGQERLVVEIVSSNPPKESEACLDGWMRLRGRLQGLPVNAHLSLQIHGNRGDDEVVSTPPPDSEHKRVAGEVRKWLEAGPAVREARSFGPLTVEYLGPYSTTDRVACSIAMIPFAVDSDPLRNSIREKACKYRRPVLRCAVPLVVVVVPEFTTGRGMDEVSEVALGTERWFLVGSSELGWRQGCCRDLDGLFVAFPSLSAVAVAEWDRGGLVHKVLRNPGATFPLPDSAFAPHDG